MNPLIANPTPLVITIEHHEATGNTRYHTNRSAGLLQQFSILAQLQRHLIDTTPGAQGAVFKVLKLLFLAIDELLKETLERGNTPGRNPATNPGTNGQETAP